LTSPKDLCRVIQTAQTQNVDIPSVGGKTARHRGIKRKLRLDAATGQATAWNPNPSTGSSSVRVNALAISGSTVYAGGIFGWIGGQPRNAIAALDAATGQATTWNPNPSEPYYWPRINALAVSGSKVYAGGYFSYIGGQTRRCIAALDAATGLATAWNPNVGAPSVYHESVCALAVSGSTVYAGGRFTIVGGQTRNHIAALDAASGAPTAWNADASSAVLALAVSGSTVYAGGRFTNIGGQTRNHIAALDTATGNATAWNSNANERVNALTVSGSTVYAGGYFTSIGGQTRNYIAALDAATGQATAWNADASSAVMALAVSGSTAYAGGYFTRIGGQARNYIAALDTGTGQATAWNPNASGGGQYRAVYALAGSGSRVYAGGIFTSIGGQARNYIAALDTATGQATAWNPDANTSVRTLAVSGPTVYAGGYFTTIGGQPRNAIAALDAATGQAAAWNPNAGRSAPFGTPGGPPGIHALAVSGSTVYAGGDFTTIGGEPRPNVAEFDLPTEVPAAPSNPSADSITTNSIRWTWTDNSNTETGFKVWADPGTAAPVTLRTTMAANATNWSQTGLSPNTDYTFQVAATNAGGDSGKAIAYTAWTLAAVPVAPVVSTATTNTVRLAVGAGSGNPSVTQYAIWCVTRGRWVQASGALGTSAAWATAATWGTKTVTGLSPDTLYEFRVKARNGAGIESAFGSAASLRTLRSGPSTAKHWHIY
jgi:hypothetical protein